MSLLRLAPGLAPALLLIGSGWLVACAKNEQKARLPKDDVVVAKVNGTPVTRYDVEQVAARSLGNLAVAASPDAFLKVRDAAVRSRAIALAAEAELSELEKQALAKEVAAYREQLLVRRYLNKHAPPAPITPDMVRSYYKDHPERFGAKTEQTYDILASTRSLAPRERDRLLASLKDIGQRADWQALVEELGKGGSPVTLTTTTSSDKLLEQSLRDLLRQLQPGKASPVTFIQGRLYMARIKGETQHPPKPFEEVSADIERLLTPGQLSDSIEAVSKQVLAGARVELLDPAPAAQGSNAKEHKP